MDSGGCDSGGFRRGSIVIIQLINCSNKHGGSVIILSQAITCAEISVFHSAKKCNEKDVNTKNQCKEIVGQHRPIARKTVILIDSLLLAPIVLYS